MTEGVVFDLKRFAVHDGDGIRTTVFLKGCPLRCRWCHNPEGLISAPQLAFAAHKCLSCGACAAVCPQQAHKMENGVHRFLRSACTACGACEAVCPADALKYYGKTVTPEELLPQLLEDKEFYVNSNGGVTISGGECLLQADFCAELLKLLKGEGISTAVDTCGFVPWQAFEAVLPYTDVFLYDLKAVDGDVHRACTGVNNELILENLRRLDAAGARVEIRIPVVPGFNETELPAMASLLAEFSCITAVRLLVYHPFGGDKYRSLGMEQMMPDTVTPSLGQYRHLFTEKGLQVK